MRTPLPPHPSPLPRLNPFRGCKAKASRESAAGKSGVLRSLLEASASGGALAGAGVCGRLGDLGVVGAEYDIAVSCVCALLRCFVSVVGGTGVNMFFLQSG